MDVLNIAIRLPFMQREFAKHGQVSGTFLTDLSGGNTTKSNDTIRFLSPSPGSIFFRKKPVHVLCFP